MSDARKPSSARELRLVQLGHVDVDQADLGADGTELSELIGVDRDVTVAAGAQEGLDALPPSGWRRVHQRSADKFRGRAEVLAAPHPDGRGTWAIVNLAERDGTWLLSVDPGPMRAFPGRAARRANLSLTWPAGLVAPAGAVPDLDIELLNESDSVWLNQCDDSAHVRAWLLDSDHRRIETTPYFAFGHGRSLPTLQPGQACTLPVTWATSTIQTLPPGTYPLKAIAVALNLSADGGALTLI